MTQKSHRLTPGEMEILGMLWQNGPLALAEAQEALGRPIGYTTLQTRLNRLVDKKLVARTKDRPARYQAAVAPEEVSADHLDDLVERVTRGNIVPLVAHLVNDRSLTNDELAELKRLVEGAEARLKTGEDRK